MRYRLYYILPDDKILVQPSEKLGTRYHREHVKCKYKQNVQ